MQKCRPLQTDIDKCRLHAGQNPANFALVNIANQTALMGALDKKLLQHAVFNHRDPGFRRRDIDQYFFAHGSNFIPCVANSSAVSNNGSPITPE